MAWNTLATTDVTAEILPDEVAALNTIQGSTGILAGILANVIAEIQASILVGGNQIGQSGTVPDQIREDVVAHRSLEVVCLTAEDGPPKRFPAPAI